MGETVYSIGEGPATRVSLSLPEGTAEAIRARVGKREFSAFIAEAVERELRGQVLDEYLADYESRKGLLADDEQVVAMTVEARSRGMEAVISAPTIIEAVHARTHKARLNWVLSGLRVIPVGEEEARAASKLLMDAGLRGRKYAIDAAVAEAALRQHRPVVMLTSDIDDMVKLCGDRVRLVAV
jgi:predicted nucleic acid-binding protein